MTGVKSAARSTNACDNFVMNQDFEKFVESRESFHDEIKSEIKSVFEKAGFECEEEYEVSGYNLKGRVDVLCRSGNDLVLTEIKSSYVFYGTLIDGLQLMIYKLLFESMAEDQGVMGSDEASGKNIHLLLVYRNPFYSGEGKSTSLKISDKTVTVPRKYVYLILKDNPQNLKEALHYMPKDKGTYIMNRDCNLCQNENCPLVRFKR
ncbi:MULTISPECIES: PD-(D/E)XK nuclease family protein [Metallosphaera]|uniref:PD-(D/E)XK nuclease family protein n=1 Tax=Metallosphaera TaxID=41980 RepID=UPI001F05EC06|nr:PD-(D/E)XK nuclease family protein [Metallosphaera sedula]MCH1771531.1 PD-(D/E)XK nuclease family protein [Metallosphaera sedula]